MPKPFFNRPYFSQLHGQSSSHFRWLSFGTSGTCKFNGGRANAKSTAKKERFSRDWTEKRFGQITKCIIPFR